jgi:short-subunit dehydrogenase involved in D-alanine esterification of teichoic acids
VHAALKGLQEAAGRCRIRHWLLRVLCARDVRLQLAAAFSSMAAALKDLSNAAAASIIAVSTAPALTAEANCPYYCLHQCMSVTSSLCGPKLLLTQG